MQTVQITSDNASNARQAYVSHICNQHVWHEFATLTFKRPLTSFEQLERAKQMFLGWLHERYYDHAEQLGEARKTINPKHYSGEWDAIPHRAGTVYPCGNQGDPITKTRRWWDKSRADYKGDDKGWRVDQVHDYHVNWDGKFVNRWKRYKHLMCPIFILGIERHKSGSWHLHSVIHHRKYAGELRRTRGWSLWHKRFGRAEITPVESQEDVAGYVSKYCCKDYYNVDPRRQAEMILSEFFGQQPKKSHGVPAASATSWPKALPGGGPAAVERLPGTLFPVHRDAPPSPFTSKRELSPSPSSGRGVNSRKIRKLLRPKLQKRGWSPIDQREVVAGELRLAAAANSDSWENVEAHADRRGQDDCPIAQNLGD